MLAFALLAPIVPLGARAQVDRSAGVGLERPSVGGAPWTAEDRRRLAQDVDGLLASAPTVRGAHVGLLAVDARSGDVLYARSPDDAFVPASTLKLLTGSAALALLGPAFRFRTAIYTVAPTGPAGSPTSFIVRAGGDPLLRASDVVALAQAARDPSGRAVPAVTIDPGPFDRAPYPPGWAWDDLPYAYAAKLTPLPIDENAVSLAVTPGAQVGDPLIVREVGPGPSTGGVCADPLALPGIATARTAAATAPSDVDVAVDANAACVGVSGTLSLGGAPVTLDAALVDPTASVLRVLRGALASVPPAEVAPAADDSARGLVWQTVPAGAHLAAEHVGEPLTDVLADMWWPSDNFVAEMLLRAIGVQTTGVGSTEAGIGGERRWLTSIGVDPATLTLADGSGLSSYDRLTPRALVAILQADWNGPQRDAVLDDLPVAGVRGTLRDRFTGTAAARRTFAKTGSMNHTRSLAGYLATVHHGAVAFAWCIDDWMGDDGALDDVRGRVLARIIGD